MAIVAVIFEHFIFDCFKFELVLICEFRQVGGQFGDTNSAGETPIVFVFVIGFEAAGDEIMRSFGKLKHFVKSKTMKGENVELAVEVCVKNDDLFFDIWPPLNLWPYPPNFAW